MTGGVTPRAGPVLTLEPRIQAEVALWMAALILALAAHLAALSWARARMPDIAPPPPPARTEVSVEMIEIATQAARPSLAQAEALEAALAPASQPASAPARAVPAQPAASAAAPAPTASAVAAAPPDATPAARPLAPRAPEARAALARAAPAQANDTAIVRAGQAPAAASPGSQSATRITGAPAGDASARPAEPAEALRQSRATQLRPPRTETPARVTAAPLVAVPTSPPLAASAERPATESRAIATARQAEDRIVSGQEHGREREAPVEARAVVSLLGAPQSAAAPLPGPAPSPLASPAPPADGLAAPASASPAALPPAPAQASAAIPSSPAPERVTASAPPAQADLAALSPVSPAAVTAAPVAPAPGDGAPGQAAPSGAAARPSDLPGPARAPGNAAPAPPDAQIDQQDRDRYAAILDYLKSYDGGPCFAALPALDEETGTLTLDAFGPTTASLGGFQAGLEARTGTIPNTYLKPVSRAQCPTLAFIRGSQAYPAFNLYFDMESRIIPSGEFLSGRILNVSGQVVHFLLVDDEGTVQVLDSLLRFTRAGASFNIQMNLTAGPVATQQLLLALGTPARLSTVTEQNGRDAASFFATLQVELAGKGISPDLSMVAFSVE